MSYQKLRIQVRLNQQKTVNGKHPLYIRIYVDGSKAEIATQHYLAIKDWNRKKQVANIRATNGQQVNAFLDLTKSRIQQSFLEYTARGVNINAVQLKNKFLGVEEKVKQKTLLDAFDYHHKKTLEKVNSGLFAQTTLNKYGYTRQKIVEFLAYEYKRKDINLTDIKRGFATNFEHYLLTREKLQTNTVYKYIKNVKRVLNLCVEIDWIQVNPLNNFKCNYISPKREVLTQEEIQNLIDKEITLPRLARIRDVFVFCCYTGFAYTDIYNLDQEAVSRGIDGDFWITTQRQKTGTRESVPLLPVALEIIKRYENDPFCAKRNKLLPVLSNQRYNSYLKELASICGINKELTSHIARHTFATTVTLSNGVPIETVSKMLGHTRLTTTQIYAKVLDTKVSQDMQQLKNKLFSVPPEKQKHIS